MATINYYKCSRCGEITRQIEISQRELASIEGRAWWEQALATINDFDGMSFLFRETGLIRPYKCSKCGRVSNRSFGGEDKGYLAG